MKGTKTILAIILGTILITGIACGSTSGSPTPTTTPTTTPVQTTVSVNASNSGGQVNISVGDLLIVKLDSNKTTGYSWNLSAISNTRVIAKVSDEYITPPPSDPPMTGQGGYEKWTFEAIAAGTANISMKYIRPWETEEPADTFEITVNVK
jgi:inhibitor of cysteine peptidase